VQLKHDASGPGALSDDLRVHVVTLASQSYVTTTQIVNGVPTQVTTLTTVPGRNLFTGVLVPAGTSIATNPGQLYTLNIPDAAKPVLENGQSYEILLDTNSDINITDLYFNQGIINGAPAGSTGTLTWGSTAINGNIGGVTDAFALLGGSTLGANGLPMTIPTLDTGGTSPTVFRDLRYNVVTTSGPMWNVNADGKWSDPSNWQNGVPDGAGSIANLASAIQTSHAITNDAPHTVGHLVFDNSNTYTISGNSLLTLNTAANTNGNAPSIDSLSGNQTISAPVALGSDTHVTVNAGSTLTISNLMPGAITTLYKHNDGTLSVNNVRQAGLNIDGGTVSILPGRNTAGTSSIAALTIAGATGALNLNDQDMVVTGTPDASIRSLLVSGYAGGSWNGVGINSATAAGLSTSAHPTAIGYGVASQILGGAGSFSGQSVNSTDVLLRYTYAGDSNLDGKVNALDFNALATSFGLSNQEWVNGDYNYDGTVDTQDFMFLANNFNAAAIAAPALGTLVPEPSIIAFGVASLALVLRRRRN
jgi:hypothetical protein